jgi:hypothetical protein
MGDEQRKRPLVVSRKDLYQQVWSTPMSRLATEYGISDRGLSKICERLQIPCLPRGYWAKKAAEKKVIQYRLPEPNEETPLEVTLRPTPIPIRPDLTGLF